MKLNYLVFLLLSGAAFANAPSQNFSFVWKNTYQLKNFDCEKLSDELEKGIVAEVRKMTDVYQHWFFMCVGSESDPNTFNITPELLLSAKNENGVQEITHFLQSHHNEVIQGISFNPLKIQKFKVQAKLEAKKLSHAGGSPSEVLGAAERTLLTAYYSEISEALTNARTSLQATDIQVVLDYIRNNYGKATELDFKNNLMPKANSLVERLYLSYLLENGSSQKANSFSQFTRACKTQTQNTCL